jgi:hypothetical protein
MLRGKLKFSNAEQRTVEFREGAMKWTRRLWVPLYVIATVGSVALAFLRPDTLSLIGATILLVSGLMLAIKHAM